MDGELLLRAIALVLIFEGLMPFISPDGWKRMFSQLVKLGDDQLRKFGLASVVIGLILLWML